MVHNVIMPKLGESVTEGTIVKWLVKPGDKINKYDPLLEVETAKVVAEVPATEAGVIKELLFQEGTVIEVGTVICTLISDKVESNTDSESFSSNKQVTEKQPSNAINAMANSKETIRSNLEHNQSINKNSQARYSPAVLSLASQHNIDLITVQGSGFEGRITRKDILSIINNNESNSSKQIPESSSRLSTNTAYHSVSNHSDNSTKTLASDTLVPVSAVRKAIAKKMVQSVSNIPHAWLTIEVDATNLVHLRNSIKKEFFNREGFNISYFSFIVVEAVKALKQFPYLNAVWQEDNILLKKDINISIAIAVENNLFVPVIPHADTENIYGIAKSIYDLAQKAKNHKLSPANMQNGTFTINNTGSFGSITSMGIINYPQAAILQVEAIVKRPVVINNAIAIRDMVNLSLSVDHRMIDGVMAGAFLQQVKHNIENISMNV